MGMALFYLGIMVLTACLAEIQFPFRRLALSILILVTLIAIPVYFEPTPRNWIQSCVLLFVMMLEIAFAHAPQRYTSPDNLRNAAFVSLKKSGAVLTKIYIATYIATLPPVPWSLSANHAPLWVQCVIGLLALDLYTYAYHRGQHRFDFWWSFHKVHHATFELTALASARTHYLDRLVKQVISNGVIVYLLGLSADAFVFGFLFPVLFIESLQHANIDFPRRGMTWLNYVLATPNVHALHHTKTEDRVNYGLVFSIWDILFGTFRMPTGRPADFGLNDPEWHGKGLLWQQVEPLQDLSRQVRRILGNSRHQSIPSEAGVSSG